MRLIDADALLEALKQVLNENNQSHAHIFNVVTNAPTVQREGWVSVEDRLPEIGENVLLFNGNILTGEYTRNEFFKSICDNYIYGATHWQPLPSSPKE